MSKLHKGHSNVLGFEPNEGQHRLLCSNRALLCCPSLSSSSSLSKETLDSLEQLGDILKKIHKKMVYEGYQIINGNIVKNNPEEL